MARKESPIPASTRALPVARGASAPAASLAVAGEGNVPALRVRALQPGFYGWMMRREGDVFDIAAEPVHPDDVRARRGVGDVIYRKGDPIAFSPTWMEKVDPATPYRVTTAPDELRQQHDDILALRVGAATGDADVI